MTTKKDAFGDDIIEKKDTNDFASMFEQSLTTANKKLSTGDKFRGEILSIGKETSYVATGTPQDASMNTLDLKDETGALKYKSGDLIDVVVVNTKGGELKVTRQGSKTAPVDLDSLEDAFDMELPVEGKVTEVVNGGYRVLLMGQTAFCPFSQLDSRQVQDPTAMVGKKFEFMITQFDSRKKNVVVSRRRLLDLQKAENEGTWIQENKVGDLLSGTITRLENFGAFVDLGGNVEGLVHISEIAFVRIKHPADSVHVGDHVQVKILKIDEEDNRLKISLSIKQAGGIDDPWMKIPQEMPVGKVVEGTVDKKEVYGLFVSLGNGINGLLPKSKWRDSVEAASFESKKKGDKIQVRIDEIKFEERKISLGLPTEADDDSWREHQTSQQFGALAAAFQSASVKKK
jgi:small subunit ribosomal protein S1